MNRPKPSWSGAAGDVRVIMLTFPESRWARFPYRRVAEGALRLSFSWRLHRRRRRWRAVQILLFDFGRMLKVICAFSFRNLDEMPPSRPSGALFVLFLRWRAGT